MTEYIYVIYNKKGYLSDVLSGDLVRYRTVCFESDRFVEGYKLSICKVCGTANSPDSSVCANCGAELRVNRRSNGTKKKRPKGHNGERPKKPKVHEDIFSSSDHDAAEKIEEPIKDLFSSDEAYEKAKKGSVLEKIHVLEEEIGDTSEIIEEEPQIVPKIINRETSNDIIRTSDAPKNPKDKKHDIPHRVIRSVKTANIGKRFESKSDIAGKEYEDTDKLSTSIDIDDTEPEIDDKAATKRIVISEKSSSVGESGEVHRKKRRPKKKPAAEKETQPEELKEEVIGHTEAAEPVSEEKEQTAADIPYEEKSEKFISEEGQIVHESTDPSFDTAQALSDELSSEMEKIAEQVEINVSLPSEALGERDKAEKEKSDDEDIKKEADEKEPADTILPEQAQESSEPAKEETAAPLSEVTEEKPVKKAVKRPRDADGKPVVKKKKKVKRTEDSQVSPVIKSRRIPDTAERLRQEKLAKENENAEKPKPKKKKVKAEGADAEAPVKKAKTTKVKAEGTVAPKPVKKKKTVEEGKAAKAAKPSSRFKEDDVAANKYLAALSYLGVLVLIPAIKGKESEFCKAHVKQGVSVLLWSLGVSAVTLAAALGLRALLIWLLGLPFIVYKVLLLAVVAAMLTLIFIPVFNGAVAAFSGIYKRIPFIGRPVDKK